MTGNQPVEGIIRSFQDLETTARRAALHGILDQLRKTEWRETRLRTAEISFHCDILGGLPLEVVILITRHLDPHDIIRLQRVSKLWQRLLTSRAVCAATLQKYAAPLTEEAPSPQFFIKYFQRRFAVETGHPYSRIFYPWDDRREYRWKPADCQLSYCSGYLAWTTDLTYVLVWDLTSGTVTRFVPESRSRICRLQLSERFLCVVTAEGYCTVWERSTGRKDTIRLPSAVIDNFTIDGDKAAVVFTSKEAPSTLLILELTTRLTRSIQISGTPLLTTFQHDHNTITVVAVDAEDTPSMPKLVLSKFTLETSAISSVGEAKTLAAIPMRFRPKFDLPTRHYENRILQSSCTITQAIISFVIVGGEWFHTGVVLSSDKVKDEITVQLFQEIPISQFATWRIARLFTSDGISYSVQFQRGKGHVQITNINRPGIWRLSEHMDLSKHDLRADRPFQVFGDSQVCGLLSLRGLEVWSFDPDFELGGG